ATDPNRHSTRVVSKRCCPMRSRSMSRTRGPASSRLRWVRRRPLRRQRRSAGTTPAAARVRSATSAASPRRSAAAWPRRSHPRRRHPAVRRAAVAVDFRAVAAAAAVGAVAKTAAPRCGKQRTLRPSTRAASPCHWHWSFHRRRRPAHRRSATMSGPRLPPHAMYRWFESRLDPFPQDPPAQPPRSLYAFCRHYTRGTEKWLLLMALTTACIAVAELALYAYVGSLVDQLGSTTPDTFLAAERTRLLWMGALVMLVLPLMVLANALVQHQTLLGNFPMRIRWNVHRYLLRQSMGYFQDEFAGRIATKLMQTSLAVRETVIKLLDIGNYVLVFFVGTLAVAGSSDWRMMLPFATWIAAYALLMKHFVPRMETISRAQADARSEMTGRIVDSYTNIATVKLFSHS